MRWALRALGWWCVFDALVTLPSPHDYVRLWRFPSAPSPYLAIVDLLLSWPARRLRTMALLQMALGVAFILLAERRTPRVAARDAAPSTGS